MTDPRIPDPGEPWYDGGLCWRIGPKGLDDAVDQLAGYLPEPAHDLIAAAPWLRDPVPLPSALCPDMTAYATDHLYLNWTWVDDVVVRRAPGEGAEAYQLRMLAFAHERGWGGPMELVDVSYGDFYDYVLGERGREDRLARRCLYPDPDDPEEREMRRRVMGDDWDPKDYDRDGWLAWAAAATPYVLMGSMTVAVLDALALLDHGKSKEAAGRMTWVEHSYGVWFDPTDHDPGTIRDWAMGRLAYVDAMFDALADVGLESHDLADTWKETWSNERTRTTGQG